MALQSTSTTSQNLTTRQAKFTHPTFAALQAVWLKLRDVREGTGGFLDGTYLIAHPREWKDHTSENPRVPTNKLRARRRIASYENVADTIIEALTGALFREQPVRRVGDEPLPEVPPPQPVTPVAGELAPAGGAPAMSSRFSGQPKPRPAPKPKTEKPPTPLEEWWEDVDGAGTHIDDFLMQTWDPTGTFGHVFLYMDRAETPAPAASDETPKTAADELMPIVRAYTPLDAWDWLVDEKGELQSIKFAELAPRESIDTAWRPEVRVRIVDTKQWRLFDQKGVLVSSGEHKMGCCPVVPLFAKRRPMEPQIGASVLGDPNLYIDLYNLVSEVRELLRNQTFGILNVPLGTGEGAMTLEDAKATMGNATGTENVLFSGTAAGFISPDSANVEAYHAEISRKLRTIYRLAGLTWESDSKDAEAEGSLELKREDMNQRLAGYADELETADYALAKLFYRATKGDTWEDAFEQDDVQIKYADTFDVTPFEVVIEQAQAASDLGMPAPFLKELRKRLAKKFDGMADLPESLTHVIEEAIDAAPDDPSPAEQMRQRMELMVTAAKSGGKPPVKAPAA